MNDAALWFSYDGGPFSGSEPTFFDPAAFAWTAAIEANWQQIREELRAVLQQPAARLLPYPNDTLTANPAEWQTFALMFWLHELPHNIARCPATWRLLKNIPGLCSASFSLLGPHATIKPHRGDTNAIMRCHLGLQVPAAAPACAIQVGDDTRSWRDGALLIFCDAHQHSAWNDTALPRYVLIFDVMRPAFMSRRRMIARRVVAAVLSEMCCDRIALPQVLRRAVFGLFHWRVLVAGVLNKLTR